MLHVHRMTKPVDFTIIGVGVAGTTSFIQLIDEIEKKTQNHADIRQKISIQLFERGDMAGPGFPFHPEKQHSSAWTLNTRNATMSLFHPEKNQNDFCDWLDENKQRLIDKYQDQTLTLNLQNSLYAPRKIFGEYCRARFEEYKRKAERLGIQVTLALETEVVNANLNHLGEWVLHTKSPKYGENKYFSKTIIVTTGHLPSTAPAADYYDAYSTYHFPKDKNVMVLGTGLTAIDAVKELLKQNHQGTIYMVSRSGDLPKIKPDISLGDYTFKYLTEKNLCVAGRLLAI